MYSVAMDRHLKDPITYNRDYQNFIQNLQKFHGSKGTGFKRVPFFGGKELDLFLLYKTVTSLGGFVKVTEEKKWREAAKCFNLPPSCTNAAFSLRQYYLRYLANYERFHFFGEDVDDAMAEMRKTSIAGSLQTSIINFGSMSSHNPFLDAPSTSKCGPLGEPRLNNFDRLVFSLKSGLPNEVDFALNICTLLSNVTNSIFNLAKAPSIIDLMLAHVGIFTEGVSSMRKLYKEWYQDSDRDFIKFWRDSIDDDVLKEIYETSCGMEASAASGKQESLLGSGICSRNTSTTNSVEANRALQVCVILHNFSYESLNCMFIASHDLAKRFLIICAGTRLNSLRKCALDTLDNLADVMTLPAVQHKETYTYMQVLHNFIFSKDRARKVRAISIIAKLASHAENEDVLSEALSNDIYEELIKCLTIPDIQLILNSLDTLYYLSDLSETTATAIVHVYRSIDILVCLVKVQAESYGNRAIAGFRIIENKNSIHAQKHTSMQQNQRSVPQPMPRGPVHASNTQLPMPMPVVNPVVNPVKQPMQQNMVRHEQQPKAEETEEVEPEIFAARWISAFYELAPGCEIRRSKIMADYLESCKELGRKGVLSLQNFYKILGLVIPSQYWKQSDVDKEDLLVTGIRQRAQPLIVKSRSVKTPARGPDMSSSNVDPSIPAHPLPVAASNPSMAPQLPMNNPPTVIPTSATLPQGVNQQQPMSHPGMAQAQFQSHRPQSNINTSASAENQVITVPKQADGQTMPLQLLQQHVNAQGSAEVAASQKSGSTFQGSQEATKQVVFPVQQTGMNQQMIGNQKLIPIQLIQSQFLQQLPTGQSPSIQQASAASTTPASQLKLLPAPSSSAATILNGPTQLPDVSQATLDPKFATPNQKTTAKEKHERKKAIKTARDIINADIRASNQDPLTQCQNLNEKIQKEMQQNFLQFHVHQQSIQAIQNQLQQVVLQNQQSKLPQNVMDDIHARVRNHHTQMQVHYQKLQQLQLLRQQVQIRLTQEQKLAGKDASNSQPESGGSKTPRILKKQAGSTLQLDTTAAFNNIQINTPEGIKQMASVSITPSTVGVQPMSLLPTTSSTLGIRPSASATPGTVSIGIIRPMPAINTLSSNVPLSFNQATVTAAKQPFPNASTSNIAQNAQSLSVGVTKATPEMVTFSSSLLQGQQLVQSNIIPSSGLNSINVLSSQATTPAKSAAKNQQTSIAVPLLSNTVNGQNLQTATYYTTGNLVASSKQFLQVPILTAVRPAVAQTQSTAKTVPITNKTPILPRPPAPMLTVSATGQSSIPGQTLLLAMPTSALTQQPRVLKDNSDSSSSNQQQAKFQQNNQGVAVLNTSRVILQNTPILQNRVVSNTIAANGAPSVVKPVAQYSTVNISCANAPNVTLKANGIVGSNAGVPMQGIVSGSQAIPAIVSKSANLCTNTAVTDAITQPRSTHAITNGQVTQSVNQLISAKSNTPVLATGSVLTNGEVNDSKDISLVKPSTLPLCTVSDASIKAVPQNGIRQLKSMGKNAIIGVDKNGLSNVGDNQNLSAVDFASEQVNCESSSTVLNVSDSLRNHTKGSIYQNPDLKSSSDNKRTYDKISDHSNSLEPKRLKFSNSETNNSRVIDEQNSLENGKLEDRKQKASRLKVNGLLTDFSHQNGETEHCEVVSSQNHTSSETSVVTTNHAISSSVSSMNSELGGQNNIGPNSDPFVTSSSSSNHNNSQNTIPDSKILTADRTNCNTDSVKSENVSSSSSSMNIKDSSNSAVITDSVKNEGSTGKKPKCEQLKQRRRAGSNCLWLNCNSCFSTSNELLTHMVFTHCPSEGKLKACQVPGCKPTQRPRGSMICHFKQVHCSMNSTNAEDDQQLTLPDLLFPKVVDMEREDESPVTRSVRLTAALILRNIAKNSSYGRQVLSAYESKLVLAAMSNSEASSAIAVCLEELTRKRRKPSDCIDEHEAS